MKRLPFALLVILASINAGAATFSGTVSAADGAALGGMSVAAYSAAGTLQATAASATNGTWMLTVPAGSYRLLAFDPAGLLATSFYQDAESFDTSLPFDVSASQATAGINFRLARGGRITGLVAAAEGSAPLAGIIITAYNASGTRRGFTTTSSAGAYAMTLPPGSYRLVAHDDSLKYGAAFYSGAATFEAAIPVTVSAAADTRADFQLQLAATISGVVTDMATGLPLGSMTVTAWANDRVAATATTTADGRFTLSLRSGAYRLVVHDASGIFATSYDGDASSFAATAPVDVVAGGALTRNIGMRRGGRINGHVTDRESGSPVAGITVSAWNNDGSVRSFTATSPSGDYTMVVPPFELRIGASDSQLRYLTQFYPGAAFTSAYLFRIAASQVVNAIDLQLIRASRIEGHVSDRLTGTVLPGITVGAYNIYGQLLASAESKIDGSFALLLPVGAVRLAAFDPKLIYATGFYAGAARFDLTPSITALPGEPFLADISLPRAGRLIGSVYSAAGNLPLSKITLFAYDEGGNVVSETSTDATGAFRLALPAGIYRLAATDPAHAYATSFYSGSATFSGASAIAVATGSEASGLRITLLKAATPSRRRASR